MRRLTLGMIAAGTLYAGTAFAIDPGTPVYVRARDTKAYPKPDAKGTPKTLEPSTTGFEWKAHQGAWNQIKVSSGKLLWVYGPNLSLTPPKLEITQADKLHHGEVSGMSAADAIKGLGDGAQWYAGKVSKDQGELAVRKVSTSEAISIKFQPAVLTKLKAAAKKSGGDQ